MPNPVRRWRQRNDEMRTLLAEMAKAVTSASSQNVFTHPLDQVKAKLHLLEIWASDRAAKSLARATWALVGATVMLVATTVVLAVVKA